MKRKLITLFTGAFAAVSFGLFAGAGSASASWSCTTSQSYKNSRATTSSCWTDTPPGTLGYIQAVQTCATSTGQYKQYGPVDVASYNDGWVISSTPSCPGYVVARYNITGYVPIW